MIPVYNNTKVGIQLAGTGYVIPPKGWQDVPFHVAFTCRKDPNLTVSWQHAQGSAVDWEGDRRHIAINSPWNPYDGYGLVGVHTVMGLERNGFIVHIGNTPSAYREPLLQMYPGVMEVASRKMQLTRWGIAHIKPFEFYTVISAKKIGWTMWESRTIPKSWLPCFDLVERLIVPSSGQVPIFRDSGVKVPIEVIHDGIDFDSFVPYERPQRDTFTFLTWGKLSPRKCPIELVECFINAFPREQYPDVRLVMKTRDNCFGGGGIVPTMTDPRITIHNRNWPLSELVRLVHEADCGVFLSHGEGFYQPPVQAMGTGLPVIVVNHSGCADFAHPKYNYPVGLNPHNPYSPSPMGLGEPDPLEWWEPDLDQTIDLMRHVYYHRDEAKKKAKRAQQWVRTKFSMDVMVRRLSELLKGLD